MAAFYALIVFRDVSTGVDGSLLRVIIAFAFLATVLMVLYTKIPLLFHTTNLKGNRFGSSRRGASGSRKNASDSSYHINKPEDLLGNLVIKYNALTKENQIAMCIKHIGLWKQLMLDAEIPASEGAKAGGASNSANFSASARNPLVASSRVGASASNYVPSARAGASVSYNAANARGGASVSNYNSVRIE